MPKSYVILTPGASAVVSLVKPQPVRTGLLRNVQMMSYNGKQVYASELTKFAPYAIGQRVAAKEKWGEVYEIVEGKRIHVAYIYDSDKGNEQYSEYHFDDYRSPVTMPLSAVRRWLVVESVECLRVKDVTNFVELGVSGNDREEMFTNFPATIIKKHGPAAWDDNAYIFLTTFKDEQ